MSPSIVVVGAGQAGVQAAEALRAGGFEGAITLLGDEPHGPYHRPPLSKAWLAGELDAAQLAIRAPEALARKRIELRTGMAVTAIDRASRTLHLADGSALPYTGLVLATGASPRTLLLPGAGLAGVLALRTRDDAAGIAERMAACTKDTRPVVVVGGGFIGLEVAATARKKGLSVTVLEAAPRLLGRVLAPVLSDWYAQLHKRHGVRVMLDTRIATIEAGPEGSAAGLRLADGHFISAGLIVVGIGVQANDRLAREAGLDCDHGIVVDACSRTSDSVIVAAGDCTARRTDDGTLLRLESVNNATEQGKSAAAALLGQERPFAGTPWFWSDQYDQKLQMAGLSTGATDWVVRGDMASGQGFSVYHFKAGRLVAVDSVNARRDHLQARKLLDAKAALSPAEVADAGFDLAACLATARA
ncbi:NAD(P)/FAD-dependent oxidoreductase [Ramlibacter sp. WS9]|uniref:NAD(P)/FAD-dependent oxidoreductase n=1 Tax=Ramlibacter sp. WS9 TaxID=1882741 RepID=UPI00114149DE|nr:FAD-dependent oxidoreductase [Ramlibacter sp. WS9]ROZ66505.1 pyridine nucleotide-disulfide oxidoreductase [Ramlibacter sp. WS9]